MMTPSSADAFLQQYLARHLAPAHQRAGLPVWLSWLLALVITVSGLICLRLGQPAALLPTWFIALGLSAAGVLAWQATAASAVLTTFGYLALSRLAPGLTELSANLLVTGAMTGLAGYLLGKVIRLERALRVTDTRNDLLRQLCGVWAESENTCLKEIDLQGRLQLMSDRGMVVMEVCDFSQICNADWVGFWQGEWAEPARHAFDQARLGRIARFSGFCPTLAGTPKWWDVLLMPVVGAGGQVESILSLSWDVSEARQHEQALRSTHDEFSALLANLSDGFYQLDEQWRFTRVNDKALELLNRPRESLLGARLQALYPDELQGELGEALHDVMDDGIPRHLEVFLPRFQAWYRVNAYPRPQGITVFFRDISADVANLQRSETTKARLRLTQEIGRFADWKFNLASRELVLSTQALQLLGLPADTPAPHQDALVRCLHPEDRLAFVSAFLDLTEGQPLLSLMVRRQADTQTDAERYFQLAGLVIRPKTHPPGLLVGCLQDVTLQQHREHWLIESEAFTRSIIDALPQLVCVLDEQGQILSANRAWHQHPAAGQAPSLLGAGEGTNYLAFCRQAAEQGAPGAQAMVEGLEGLLEGIAGPFSLDYRLDEGVEARAFQACAMPIAIEQRRFLVVHEDVTEAVTLQATLNAQAQRLRLAHEGSNDGLWEWRPEDNSLYVSERFVELTGYSLDGHGNFVDWLIAHVHRDDNEALFNGWDAHLERGEPFDVELRLNTADGWHWFRLRGKAEWDGQRLVHFAGSLMDIGVQRELLERVQASETRFREMVEFLPHVFWIYDLGQARLSYVSPAFEKVWGLPVDTLYAEPGVWLSLVHPDDQAAARDFHAESLQGRPRSRVEFRSVNAQGEQLWIRNQAFAFRDPDGRVARVVGIAENITETRTYQDRLHTAAHYDSQSGLPNRLMFGKRLEQQCGQARRTERPFMVLAVTLDRVKWVQQYLGESAKGLLIGQLAERFRAALAERGYLARFDNESFGVLLSREEELAQAGELIETLLAALAPPHILEGRTVKLNAFIGVARFPDDGESAETLIRNANATAFALQQTGHSGYQYFNREQMQLSLDTLKLEMELERALEQQEFVLHYQPKLNLGDQRICGAEALIRWQHPLHGLVPPLRFIHQLEASGLIVPVGLWCIDQALAQLAAWRRQGLEGFVMAVNLSIRQLQPDLVGHVREALARHGLPPGSLELELTESIMHEAHGAKEIVNQLRALGVRIAVDDFGTGYATLDSLRSFVPDTVKIDKSFLQGMLSDEADHAIVRSVIQMAHALHMIVVAEGVERVEQRRVLEQLRCDHIQGYLISPPVAAEVFERHFVQPDSPALNRA